MNRVLTLRPKLLSKSYLLTARLSTNRDNFSDEKLVFYGSWKRTFSLLNLFKLEGKCLWNKLMYEIGDFPHNETLTKKVFQDLHHPLLLKYNFDRDSFMAGTKEAGNAYLNALLSPKVKAYFDDLLKVQKDGKETVLFVPSVPDQVSFIESTSSPNLFNALKAVYKTLGTNNLSPSATGFMINNHFIVDINVEVYRDSKLTDFDRILLASKNITTRRLVNFLIYPNRDESEIEPWVKLDLQFDKTLSLQDNLKKVVNHFNQIQYPNGSVIAMISVLYEVDITYKGIDKDEVLAKDAIEKQGIGEKSREIHCEKSRNLFMKLIFSGCISNQDELEWKIIHVSPVYCSDEEYEQDAEDNGDE